MSIPERRSIEVLEVKFPAQRNETGSLTQVRQPDALRLKAGSPSARLADITEPVVVGFGSDLRFIDQSGFVDDPLGPFRAKPIALCRCAKNLAP